MSLHVAGGKNEDENVFQLTYEEKMKKMKKLTFVSSNLNKIKEVNMILGGKYPWELICHNVDLTEPQATPIEVSRAKCAQAALLCEGPVIVEDTSLCFNALNGLPGPYIKWFYEAIGNEGLVKLLDGYEDKSGYAQCVLSFSVGSGQEIKTFVGCTDGTICYPKGPQGFGWDPIFIVSGFLHLHMDLFLNISICLAAGTGQVLRGNGARREEQVVASIQSVPPVQGVPEAKHGPVGSAAL